MSEAKTCPHCGKSVPSGAPGGLCPDCLLKAGEPTGASEVCGPNGTRIIQPAPQAPPSPAEIAKYFPQLEIVDCLGRGGMGVVYKARQPKLNRFVALKILAPERGSDPKFAERFLREAQTLARLNHPNIVAVYDFGEVDGLYYLVMEYVDGVSLRQLIQSRKITPHEALSIVPRICEALQFAHEQGVVHRDIKPENVLVDRRGQVKIADFGIAKIVGLEGTLPSGGPNDPNQPEPGLQAPANLTQEQVLGTPQYMAPEQREHPQQVDHRADIYSLGIVFYEMLTGELPGKSLEPPSRKVEIDVRLDEVVLRALQKEPERRYQQASQVKSDVETIATTSSPKSEPQGSKSQGQGAGPTGKEAQPINTQRYALEKAIVGAGTIFFIGFFFLVMSTVSNGAVRAMLIAQGSIGFAITLLCWAGLWPFPSTLFPRPNFSSRNLKGARTTPPPRPPTPTSEQEKVNDAEWANSRNWSLGLYFSKRDSRIWVPKRNPALGWTVNLGHWQGVASMFAIFAVIIGTAIGISIYALKKVESNRLQAARANAVENALCGEAVDQISKHGYEFNNVQVKVTPGTYEKADCQIAGLRRAADLQRNPLAGGLKIRYLGEGRWVFNGWGALNGLTFERDTRGEMGLGPGRLSSASAVEQTAPDRGPFVAQFPGGSLELLAVRAYPSTNGPWWAPDGSESTLARSLQGYADPVPNEMQGYHFIVRHIPADPRHNFIHCINPKLYLPYDKNGEHPSIYHGVLCQPALPDATETTLEIWLGLDPWETVAVQKPGILGALASSKGRGNWSWSAQADGSVLLEIKNLTPKQDRPTTERLFVAVDEKGVEHRPWRTEETTGATKIPPFKATFGGPSALAGDRALTLDQIKEFRLKVRHGSPVAFKNVSLRPGHRTKVVINAPSSGLVSHSSAPSQPLTVGPAMEKPLGAFVKSRKPVQWKGNRIVSRVLPYPDFNSLFIRLPIAHAAATGQGIKVAVIQTDANDAIADAVRKIAPDAEVMQFGSGQANASQELAKVILSSGCRVALICDPSKNTESVVRLAQNLVAGNVLVVIPSDLSEAPIMVEVVNKLHDLGCLTVARVDRQSMVLQAFDGKANRQLRSLETDVFSTVGMAPDEQVDPAATAAGVAALVLERWPGLSPSLVRQQIVSGARCVWQATSLKTGEWQVPSVDPISTRYTPRDEQSIFRFWVLDAAGALGVDTEIPWFLNMLNCQEAWKLTRGKGMRVVVSDQGFHLKHPELAGHIETTKHFGPITFDAEDQNFHGTDMSRILLSVAPQARIIPVLCSGSGGPFSPTTASNIAESFRYAAELNADVATASWAGSFNTNEDVLAAIRHTVDHGTVLSWFHFPQPYPGLLRSGFTYGGLKNGESRLGFADRFLTDPPGFHPVEIEAGLSGTAPQAAGLAALVKSVNPGLSPSQVEELIVQNATPIGNGILIPDASKAVLAAAALPHDIGADSSRRHGVGPR